MNKNEIAKALTKKPTELTKEELQFIFNILSLTVKEYHIRHDELSFEIHFKRVFIIKVEYPIERGIMSFRNEFVNMGENCHGMSISCPKDTANLINIFFNLFFHNLLADADYDCYYSEETSIFSSLEDAKEHLKILQKQIDLSIKSK